MSIEFYPYQTLSTNNSTLLNNVPSASISFLLKINSNSDLSDVGLSFITSREFYNGYYFDLIASGTTNGTIKARTSWLNYTGSGPTKDVDLPLGVTVHIASTYSQGSQVLYVNGVQYLIGSLTGNIQSTSRKFRLGAWDLTPNSGYSWKIDKLAVWNDYALTRQEVLSLRAGVASSSFGGSVYRSEWTLDGPIGSSVQIGNSGVNDIYGVANFATIAGSSTPKYAEELIWEPSAFIQNAYIGTGGETLFFSFVNNQSGETTPILAYDPISIYKNGSYIGQSKDLWLTGSSKYIMYTFPSGESATQNDTISVSSSGWILTIAGDVNDVTNYTVINNVDRSCFDTENITKTLPLGFNVIGTTDNGTFNFVFKNLSLKCSPFQGTTYNISGYPISTSITNCASHLIGVNNSNGIDLTGTPGITGLVVISWDRTNNSAPTTFFLHSSDFSTNYIRCTERLDLYNPGDTGTYPGQTIGMARAYNVQLTSSSVYTPLTVYFTTTSSTPYFNNLSVQHESDFTYTSGIPVVLDRSNKFAVSNLFLERTRNAGSLRFIDQLVGNPIQGNISEYEDMVGVDDFCFNSMSKRRWTIYYDHLKAFYPGNSPYIYSPIVGSSYSATLGSNINSSQTNIDIPDATTAKVIYGQKLFIDNEILSVLDVSGTTVTVQRGYEDTLAVSHNSGVISVGYRFPSSGVFANNVVVYELVSVSSHYLRTGYTLPYDGGNYPYIIYTNGSSGQISNSNYELQSPVFVTSPSSYLVASYITPTYEVSGVYDLSGRYSSARIPYSFHLAANPCINPAIAASITSQVDGADLFWNIPYNATNDFVIKSARDVRNNLPAGRNIYIELANEMWNFLTPNIYIKTINGYFDYSYEFGYALHRTDEIKNIIKNVFNESGLNRGGEIKTIYNIQTVVDKAAPVLNYCLNNNISLDCIANAPYIGPYYQHNATISGYTFCNTSQAIDLYIHDLYYGTDSNSLVGVVNDHINAINTYNASGYNCRLVSYEGGLERPISTTLTPWAREKMRDMIFHKNQIIANQDFFHLLQNLRYYRFNIFTLSHHYYQGVYNWTYYGGFLQKPGLGDGSDGLFDNSMTLATPGYEHYKGSGINQDANVVSTRGKSFLLWNESVISSDISPRYVLSYFPQYVFKNIFIRGF